MLDACTFCLPRWWAMPDGPQLPEAQNGGKEGLLEYRILLRASPYILNPITIRHQARAKLDAVPGGRWRGDSTQWPADGSATT